MTYQSTAATLQSPDGETITFKVALTDHPQYDWIKAGTARISCRDKYGLGTAELDSDVDYCRQRWVELKRKGWVEA